MYDNFAILDTFIVRVIHAMKSTFLPFLSLHLPPSSNPQIHPISPHLISPRLTTMPSPSPPTATNTILNPPQPPLPPLNTLVRPQYIQQLFRTNEQQATIWHRRFTHLWQAALHHPDNATRQLAHRKLAYLSQMTRNALDKHRRARAARQAEAAAAAVQSQQGDVERRAAVQTGTLTGAGSTIASGEIDFVHLDVIPFEHRFCSMCRDPYCVKKVDGQASFQRYPVQLSACHHLVCFGCAKVLLRMYVNCTRCGASFGDGKAELVRIEAQIQLFGQRFRNGKLGAVEAGSGQSHGGDSDAVVGDGLTRKDVEAALTLLNLAGKKFSMEDVRAGLALLDLRGGTDTTLEDYLLAISRQ